MREIVSWLLRRVPQASRALEAAGPLGGLAASYAASICRGPGCVPEAAALTALALVAAREEGRVPGWVERLPRHLAPHVARGVEEALDAYLRSPTSPYAQAALDAEALSWMGGVSGLLASAGSLGEMLGYLANAMTYAVALEYILYTASARSIGRVLKPHTMALAKWAVEELAYHGIRAVQRVERSTAGLVGYVEVLECPCGRASKEVVVKPRRECIEYRVEMGCGECGSYRFTVCTPESNRVK